MTKQELAPDAPGCVLVVEDEVLVRMVAVEGLESAGYLVEEAGTAGEALDKFRATHVYAAVIDVGLPDRKGDELARELREMRADLPIIIATGYAEADVATEFAGDKFMRWLSKPYDVEELSSILGQMGVPSAKVA